MATLVRDRFHAVRFSMLLRGPGVDDVGRAWVEAHLPADHLAIAPPGVFVADGAGELLVRIGYREPAPRWLEALRPLVPDPPPAWADQGERPLLRRIEAALQSGRSHKADAALRAWLDAYGASDPDGAAWAKLLRGVAAYRRGAGEAARTHWTAVITEHPGHPLVHRASYHLKDSDTWPTRPHADLVGAPALPVPTQPPPAPEHVPVPGTLVDGLGLELVPIPAGSFTLGGSPAFLARELPTHRVTLTRPLLMSATVVTSEQWAAFSGEAVADDPTLPRTGISFAAAEAFCAWLSERESARYRLPTEAEWEWASRGGLEGACYPWGDAPITPERCNYLGPRPVPVRSYPPNGYGLYEMVGNVQEWTSDRYRERAYAERAADPAACVDPQGPASADRGLPLRVVRGGQCGASVIQLFCRNSFRLGLFEEYAGGSIGLRVVREV